MKDRAGLEHLVVYQEALRLVAIVFRLCRNPLINKEYVVTDQIRRSSLSILLNIAEGYGRLTERDKKHYLSIALGSCNETRAAADAIQMIEPFLSQNSHEIIERCIVLSKRLYVFRSKFH
jgi:four helix bundle protein